MSQTTPNEEPKHWTKVRELAVAASKDENFQQRLRDIGTDHEKQVAALQTVWGFTREEIEAILQDVKDYLGESPGRDTKAAWFQ